MDLAAINLLIVDVDGVLTDGSIFTSPEGEFTKRFHVQDGFALQLWQRRGRQAALLSGRSGEAVHRRAAELGIRWVKTGIEKKLAGYEALLASANCDDRCVAYVGDDLPDLAPMARAAFPVAVANANPAVKRAATYVTRRRGGQGAVAEVVELLLRKQGRWSPDLIANSE